MERDFPPTRPQRSLACHVHDAFRRTQKKVTINLHKNKKLFKQDVKQAPLILLVRLLKNYLFTSISVVSFTLFRYLGFYSDLQTLFAYRLSSSFNKCEDKRYTNT